MYLPIFVLLVTLDMPGFHESFSRVLLIAFLVLAALMIPICLLNAVVSIASAVKGKEDPTKATLTTKLALIPWYIMNFVVGFIFSSIFFNPFMFIAIPIVIAFFVGMTYLLMLSTSLGDIAYFVKKKIKKDEDVRAATVLAVICLFIFFLDIIGAIVLYRQSKRRAEREQTPPAEQN